MNNRFSKLVQEFLTSYIMNECNYSINTKNSYATTFYLLLEFMNEEKNISPNKIEIESIDKETIIQFLNWLETDRNVSISTRNQRLSCLKSFFKFVQANNPDLYENCASIISIKYKKVPKKRIPYFSEKEIKILINYLKEINDLKKLTMISVLYETGARVTELINIKLKDLDLEENASITLYGKNGKVRTVPINQELVKIINKYLDNDYINYDEGYLFYSTHKKRYHRDSINKMIKKLSEILKEKYPNYFKENYHPHTFRHSKASHLYNNATPLLYVKEFLGHSTIASTEIYATPDAEKQREEILKNSNVINTKKRYSSKKIDELENWLKNNMK